MEDDLDNISWITFDAFIDFWFFVELVINFTTAYYDDRGKLVSERVNIIKNYFKSWFLIDFVTLIPISYFLSNIG